MSEVIERTIKFVTTIRTLLERPLVDGVYPMREWTCQVLMDDGQGNEITPPFIEKVIFKLHPTFANPNKSKSLPPSRVFLSSPINLVSCKEAAIQDYRGRMGRV